jgi:hypothetical protein
MPFADVSLEVGSDAMGNQAFVSGYRPYSFLLLTFVSAWLFYKVMNISGAEAVVAAGSPFVGIGESACLVRPYVDIMTESELHLTMTSGMCPTV